MKDVRIVVLPAGFVHIGEYHKEGEVVTLTNAHNLRRSGTTKGYGELYAGPTKETVLDPLGFVETHQSQVIFTVRCSPDWPL